MRDERGRFVKATPIVVEESPKVARPVVEGYRPASGLDRRKARDVAERMGPNYRAVEGAGTVRKGARVYRHVVEMAPVPWYQVPLTWIGREVEREETPLWVATDGRGGFERMSEL